MNELSELLDHYFSLGVAEGKEGRDHDTADGEAQATRDLIDMKIDRLSRMAERERSIDADYDEIRRGARIAADAEYAIGPDETAFDRAIDAALEWSFMAIAVAAAAPPSPKPAAVSEGGEDE